MNSDASRAPEPAEAHGLRASVDRPPPQLVLPDGQKWPLTSENLGIGRRIGNHILVDDPLVSSEHAKIISVDRDYVLVDLRSANGTFVNGQRIDDLHILCDGDQIEVAGQRFQFLNPPSPGPLFQPASSAANGDQDVELELAVLLLDELLLNKPELTIGRAPENALVLADPRVSSRHAKIMRTGSDYWLLDLGSRNGIFVNEHRVRDVHRLRSGDVIAIGATRLSFVRRKVRLDDEEAVELEALPSFVFSDVSGRRWQRFRALAIVTAVVLIVCTFFFIRFVFQ